jgi:hypothetical protein
VEQPETPKSVPPVESRHTTATTPLKLAEEVLKPSPSPLPASASIPATSVTPTASKVPESSVRTAASRLEELENELELDLENIKLDENIDTTV